MYVWELLASNKLIELLECRSFCLVS